MINRIREIRKAKGMTLADLAEACSPPTTAQTIGRLETGMRNLSTKWMDRIGHALGVDPQVLVRSEEQEQPKVMFELVLSEAVPLATTREFVLPHELEQEADGSRLAIMEVTYGVGEYRAGDLIWLRFMELDQAPGAVNRDCLVVSASGRAVFGRLIDAKGSLVGVLPVQSGQKQQVIDKPRMIAVSIMLVRPL